MSTPVLFLFMGAWQALQQNRMHIPLQLPDPADAPHPHAARTAYEEKPAAEKIDAGSGDGAANDSSPQARPMGMEETRPTSRLFILPTGVFSYKTGPRFEQKFYAG